MNANVYWVRRKTMNKPNDVTGNSGTTFCSTCDGGGWMWPNLGVNVPAGAVWAVSSAQAMAIQHGHNYFVRCQACNSDGHKPHPDQAKIDTAKEIDEAGQ